MIFMPMIDLSPSDPSCIHPVYSTMVYVSAQAQKNQVTPVLTFDQPLYMKATMILQSPTADRCLKSLVLNIGSFHTLMSFPGSIGHVMGGFGLEDVFELVYAANTVSHNGR